MRKVVISGAPLGKASLSAAPTSPMVLFTFNILSVDDDHQGQEMDQDDVHLVASGRRIAVGDGGVLGPSSSSSSPRPS